ncbi:helix-turn-helix domain-containing protein [Anaerorhabdus sp.]|uniref:helix-turn-helix domain-containing protein n=1 Tax=Anaerorhabdus sp. TaxID=1872524 RepID=UPI002FC912B4
MAKVKAADVQVEGLSLSDVDFTLQTFGEFLRSVRKARRVSIREFEERVHKTRAYLSDIERGKSKPPDQELLGMMIEQLNLEGIPNVINRLYDLAAVERNAVPDDLKTWIMADATHRDLLRKCRDKKLTSAQVNGLLKIVEDM